MRGVVSAAQVLSRSKVSSYVLDEIGDSRVVSELHGAPSSNWAAVMRLVIEEMRHAPPERVIVLPFSPGTGH